MPTSSSSWVALVDIILIFSRGVDLLSTTRIAGDHAAVDVVESSRGRSSTRWAGVTGRSRHLADHLVEQGGHPLAGLARDPQRTARMQVRVRACASSALPPVAARIRTVEHRHERRNAACSFRTGWPGSAPRCPGRRRPAAPRPRRPPAPGTSCCAKSIGQKADQADELVLPPGALDVRALMVKSRPARCPSRSRYWARMSRSGDHLPARLQIRSASVDLP